MTRWGLRTIALYSRHGKRRDIDLRPGAVNIITGDSHTGKSAIAELIDFSLGASDCHIPPFIRDRVSWVALLWERNESRFIIARPVPAGNDAPRNHMYWERGGTFIDLPKSAGDLSETGTRPSIMRLLEEELGMADVVGETFSTDRVGQSISARQLMPYLLQDDDVIINKSVLFRGAQDERRRGLIDALPYFLRVSDENTSQLEEEYRRLTRKRAVEERRAKDRERLVADEHDRAHALLAEAIEVGLAPNVAAEPGLAATREVLRTAAAWVPAVREVAMTSPLTKLFKEERDIRSDISRVRTQIRQSEAIVGAAEDFDVATNVQAAKLEHLDLFRDTEDHAVCPICQSDVQELVPSVDALRQARASLASDLASVRRARPQLERFVADRRTEFDQKQERLRVIREQIRAISSTSDGELARLDLEHRRSRVAGRISLYLDSQVAEGTEALDDIAATNSRIQELEALLDFDAKKDRLATEQQAIGAMATKILASLPFAPEYTDPTVYFLARTLDCGILTDDRRVPMRDVGSDENYLSLHVALALAFHRFFARRRVPVPGLLLLDQISRPYYPPDQQEEEVKIQTTEDAKALRRYFQALYRESEREQLQIIVLEHAYLTDDERFVAAVVERWSKSGAKLVPADWPT